MNETLLLGLVFAALATASIVAWRAARTKSKVKQLTTVNRSQRKVIDSLIRANEAQVKLKPIFKEIEEAKTAEEYEKIYSDILDRSKPK